MIFKNASFAFLFLILRRSISRMDLKDLQNDWIKEFPTPLGIAGPCSAESEAQMLETAQRLKESGAEVPVFRAGIWKPRTKPFGLRELELLVLIG
jgi:chorismate mutase